MTCFNGSGGYVEFICASKAFWKVSCSWMVLCVVFKPAMIFSKSFGRSGLCYNLSPPPSLISLFKESCQVPEGPTENVPSACTSIYCQATVQVGMPAAAVHAKIDYLLWLGGGEKLPTNMFFVVHG